MYKVFYVCPELGDQPVTDALDFQTANDMAVALTADAFADGFSQEDGQYVVMPVRVA